MAVADRPDSQKTPTIHVDTRPTLPIPAKSLIAPNVPAKPTGIPRALDQNEKTESSTARSFSELRACIQSGSIGVCLWCCSYLAQQSRSIVCSSYRYLRSARARIYLLPLAGMCSITGCRRRSSSRAAGISSFQFCPSDFVHFSW